MRISEFFNFKRSGRKSEKPAQAFPPMLDVTKAFHNANIMSGFHTLMREPGTSEILYVPTSVELIKRSMRMGEPLDIRPATDQDIFSVLKNYAPAAEFMGLTQEPEPEKSTASISIKVTTPTTLHRPRSAIQSLELEPVG